MGTNVKSFPKKAVSDYKSIRSEIENGDISICSGSSWFSKMIKAASDSVWSHVAIVMRLKAIDRIMDLKRDSEYICSEYVWECYHSLGIDIPHDPRGFITPAAFAKAKEMQLKYVLKRN